MSIKYYGVPGQSFFVISYVETPPMEEGMIEIKNPRPTEGDWHLSTDGRWLPGDQNTELEWISNEMDVIKEQLLLHEDGDLAAVATEEKWREYRKQLRRWNWGDNEHFPDATHRPTRPQ